MARRVKRARWWRALAVRWRREWRASRMGKMPEVVNASRAKRYMVVPIVILPVSMLAREVVVSSGGWTTVAGDATAMIILVPGLVYSYSQIWRDRRMKRLAKAHRGMLCERCAYDLGSLGARGRCPECGRGYWLGRTRGRWAFFVSNGKDECAERVFDEGRRAGGMRAWAKEIVVAEVGGQTEVAAGPDGGGARVSGADQRVCVRCGYALRGLDVSGVCPECGTAVSASLGVRLLAEASKVYLARVLSGLNLLVVGLWIGMVLVPVAAVLRVGEEWRAAVEPWQEVGFSAGWLVWAMLMWEGSRRYGAVDVRNERAMGPVPGRYMMMGAMTGAVVSAVNWIGVGGIVRNVPEISEVLLMGALAGMIVLGLVAMCVVLTGPICWSVWFFGVVRSTRWIGRRIPDATVGAWTTRMMWAVPLAIVGSGVLMWLANRVLFGEMLPVFEKWVAVTVVCVEGALVWMMLMLVRVRVGVRAAMKKMGATTGGERAC